MRILGIETSCDETAAAVVENGTKILSNVVTSSVELHQKTGGIIPEVAAREQLRCIIPVIEEAIENVKLKMKNEKLQRKIKKYSNIIDAIAVTIGPGLIGSLLVGVETAKTLAYLWKKPIIPVNHLQAHLYANWLDASRLVKQWNSKAVSSKTITGNTVSTDYRSTASPPHRFTEIPHFPAIGLVVSGGHTDLVLMRDHPSQGRGKIRWLGGTRDDAAGECLDKCARILGLGYPGGPEIARLAEKGNPQAFKLPRPMIDQKNFDFSFAGLKTAVVNEVRKLGWEVGSPRGLAPRGSESKHSPTFPTSRPTSHISPLTLISNLAASIQEAVIDVLVTKTSRAAQKYKVKSILLAGGVAANQRLRGKFFSHPLITNYQLLIPPSSLCTDNAAIVSCYAYFNFKPVPWEKIRANPSLEIEEMVK
jgi:N6-L-threonylcarbamoyladenine synthase